MIASNRTVRAPFGDTGRRTLKIVMSSYGTRGEVEPCIAVGRELRRRSHEVCIAVPPNLVGFTEQAGLPAVAYELDSQTQIAGHVNYWRTTYSNRWNVGDRAKFRRQATETGIQATAEQKTLLMSLAKGADLLLTGVNGEHPASDVAERHNIPLATLHLTPWRVRGRVAEMREQLMWRAGVKKFENTQRREFGLADATGPLSHRMANRGSLEIQAYDEVFFPGLARDWAKLGSHRPFIGYLTLESPTEFDQEVLSWIAEGKPPICFGFGSMQVESSADTMAMIAAACERLDERALICGGVNGFDGVSDSGRVKFVPAVNHSAILPSCRAVVHHGSGATAAGLRAGLPTLVLWKIPDQLIWGNAISQVKVGTARCFFSTTEDSLVSDLRRILSPEYSTRAREISTMMAKPADSASDAADLVESLASGWSEL